MGVSGTRSAAVVSYLCPRTEPEVDSCTYLVMHNCRKEQRDALLPCIQWLRCRLTFRGNGVFTKLSQDLSVVNTEDQETLEKFVVMVYDRFSTVQGVDDARLDIFARKQSLYKAIPLRVEAACEACCLPGGLHLESVNSMSARNAESCQLGLAQETRSVAGHSDRVPTHCTELPAADQVWMQIGMLWSMQMLLFWSDLHGIVQL